MPSEWIPALTTAGLTTTGLLAVGWLCRNLIATRLKASVEHEFNTQLEGMKAQLRESEERLKARLREKDAQMAGLQQGALSALAGKHEALDKRRLQAAEEIWAAACRLKPARTLAMMIAPLNTEYIAKHAEEKSMQAFLEQIGMGFTNACVLESHTLSEPARPFVTPMVWAVFNAMTSICAFTAMSWHAMKGGLDIHKYAQLDKLNELIEAALPGHLSQSPDSAHARSSALGLLEVKLLDAIAAMLEGRDESKRNVEQAALILAHARAVSEGLAQQPGSEPPSE